MGQSLVRSYSPNDPSSATRPTRRYDCNRDAHAGLSAAHGHALSLRNITPSRTTKLNAAKPLPNPQCRCVNSGKRQREKSAPKDPVERCREILQNPSVWIHHVKIEVSKTRKTNPRNDERHSKDCGASDSHDMSSGLTAKAQRRRLRKAVIATGTKCLVDRIDAG